jgi:hypothetical protein
MVPGKPVPPQPTTQAQVTAGKQPIDKYNNVALYLFDMDPIAINPGNRLDTKSMAGPQELWADESIDGGWVKTYAKTPCLPIFPMPDTNVLFLKSLFVNNPDTHNDKEEMVVELKSVSSSKWPVLKRLDRTPFTFTSGEAFWYFWTRDEELYKEVKAAYEAARKGKGFNRLSDFVLKYGFSLLEVGADHLVSYNHSAPFAHEIQDAEWSNGTVTDPKKAAWLKMAALLYCVRPHIVAQGLVVDAGPLIGLGPSPILLARRPAISAMYLAEVISGFATNHHYNSIWNEAKLAEMEAIVSQAKTHGGLVEYIRDNMQGDDLDTRIHRESFREYAFDCARATMVVNGKPDGKHPAEKPLDESLFRDALGYNDVIAPQAFNDRTGWRKASTEITEKYHVKDSIGKTEPNLPPGHPVNPASLTLRADGDDAKFAVECFKFYRLAFERERAPRVVREGQRLGKDWRSVFDSSASGKAAQSKALAEKARKILHEYGPYGQFLADLGAHHGNDPELRKALHQRYLRVCAEFHHKFWVSLELPPPPYCKNALMGQNATVDVSVLDTFFDERTHALALWLAPLPADAQSFAAAMLRVFEACGGDPSQQVIVGPPAVVADIKGGKLHVTTYDHREVQLDGLLWVLQEQLKGAGRDGGPTRLDFLSALPKPETSDGERQTEGEGAHKGEGGEHKEEGGLKNIVKEVHELGEKKENVDTAGELPDQIKEAKHAAHKLAKAKKPARRSASTAKRKPKVKPVTAPKFMETFFATVGLIDAIWNLSKDLEEKGKVATLLPLADKTFVAAASYSGVIEFTLRRSADLTRKSLHMAQCLPAAAQEAGSGAKVANLAIDAARAEEKIRKMENAAQAIKGASKVFGKAAVFVEAATLVVVEAPKHGTEARDAIVAGQHALAAVRGVQGAVALVGGVAGMALTAAGAFSALAGLACAGMFFAMAGPIVAGAGIIILVGEGVVWILSDDSRAKAVDKAFQTAVSRELGARFHEADSGLGLWSVGSARVGIGSSRAIDRLKALVADVDQALDAIATPPNFATGYVLEPHRAP